MLKGFKVPGPDGVPKNLLKDAAKSIAKPLMMIFNASLAKVWKLAKTTHGFNYGARHEKDNYRPTSFLFSFYKAIRKIARDSYQTTFFHTRY